MESREAVAKSTITALRRYEVVDKDMTVVLVGASPVSLRPADAGATISPEIVALIGDILMHHDFTSGPAIAIVGKRLRVRVVRLVAHGGDPYYGIASERVVHAGRPDGEMESRMPSRRNL